MAFVKNMLNIGLFFGALSAFTSCATIINGPRQNIAVTSNPVGATVTDGKSSWTTPATISLTRKEAHLLAFSKPGYATQVVEMHRAMNSAVIANILIPFGSLIGWGIDASTGAQWKLVPDTVNIELKPESAFQKAVNAFEHAIMGKDENEKMLDVVNEQTSPSK